MWSRIRLPLLQMCCESLPSCSHVCERGGHAPMSAMSQPRALDAAELSMRRMGLRRCNVRTGRDPLPICVGVPVSAASLVASSGRYSPPLSPRTAQSLNKFLSIQALPILELRFYRHFYLKLLLKMAVYVRILWFPRSICPDGQMWGHTRRVTQNLQTFFPFCFLSFLFIIYRETWSAGIKISKQLKNSRLCKWLFYSCLKKLYLN